MTEKAENTRWGKILPIIGKGTGSAAIALVTLATIDSIFAQVGAQGLSPALLNLLSSLFGDVVAGPFVDRLLSGTEDSSKFDDLIKKFEKQLQQDDIRKDIATLLSNQEIFTNVLGLALQYHENSAVERILRGVACYQDFGVERIIQKLGEGYSEGVKSLDPEIQYLIDLIANLQSRGGLWYINLPVQADQETIQPKSSITASWKLPQVFALLEQSPFEEKSPIKPHLKARFPNIQEVIKKHSRFVLVGEPGSGKTTTIQHLALEAALKRLSDPTSNPLPMLLYLPSWSDNYSLEDFIYSRWRLIPDPIELLTRGELHIYLDGLNEIGASGPSKAKKLREWLRNERSPKYIIVTCRKTDYTDDFDLDLPYVLIEDMPKKLIQEFVSQYLEAGAALFLKKIFSDRKGQTKSSLSTLARNPFMLVSLMIIYRSSPTGDLPRNNGELFQRLVRALWERERIRNTPGWTPFDDIKINFSRLAFAMIDEAKPTDVPISYALKYIEDPHLLQAGQSANLVEINIEKVRFYHQLIQEYFAAEHVKSAGLIDMLKKPSFDYKGRTTQKWDQVIIALAGITTDKDALFDDLINRDPYLAAMCVKSGIKLSLWIQDKLEEALVSELSHSNANKRLAAAKALAQIGWNPQDVRNKALYCIASCDWIRCARLGLDAVSFLISATEDADEDVRHGALWALQIIEDAVDVAQISKEQDSKSYGDYSKDDLVGLVTQQQKEGVWATVFSKVIKHQVSEDVLMEQSTEPEIDTKKLINDLHHPNINTCLSSILHLGKHNEAEAVPPLIQILHENTIIDVHLAAIWALGEIGDTEAIPILIEKSSNENCTVRWFSANALGKLGDPTTVSALIDRLDDNEKPSQADRYVCEVAAEALERIDTPEAIAAIENWRRNWQARKNY